MIVETPEHAVELLDAAFGSGDIETIVKLYDESAVVIPMPGMQARGLAEIRAMYERLLQPGTSATQNRIKVLEADGIALFISRWTLRMEGQQEQSFIATTVFRKQPDSGWKALIDNARGPAILDEA